MVDQCGGWPKKGCDGSLNGSTMWMIKALTRANGSLLDGKILWLEHLEMSSFYQMTWACLCSCFNILSFDVVHF